MNMKWSILITGSISIAFLLAILGCSSVTSTEVKSTPHAEATFEPKTDTPTSSASLSKIEHSHETHSKNANVLTGSGLLKITEIERSVRCAVGRGSNCSQEFAIERGLLETGLEPIFPLGIRCPVIDHHYAMDYSAFRLGKEYYHGGIDIPVPFNTPVIAAATGQVVGIYVGDKSPRGIEIVFRHSPEDTGLPVWTFTQYTHFSELPNVVLGQSIEIGDVIGLTGNTGISPKTGKQADARRPALHFGVLYNSNGEYADMKNAVIVPANAKWMDPNAFFLVDHPFDTETLRALPENEKAVPIPVLLDDGNTIPSDTKTVWPYTCSKDDASTTEPKKEMPQTAHRDAVASTASPTVTPEPTVPSTKTRLIGLGWNKPTSVQTTYLRTSDLSDDSVSVVEDGIRAGEDYLGSYGPLRVYVIGTDVEAAHVVAMDFCSWAYGGVNGDNYEYCVESDQGVEIREIAEHAGRNAFAQHSRELETPNQSFVIGNPLQFESGLGSKIAIHEYVHIYQNANKVDENDFGLPLWLEEGSAEFLALYLGQKEGWADFQMGMAEALESAKDLQKLHPGIGIQDIETSESRDALQSFCDCTGMLQYETGQWATAWLVNRTSLDIFYKSYIPDIVDLGGHGSFEKHFGLTVQEFYGEFDAFMSSGAENQLAILPIP